MNPNQTISRSLMETVLDFHHHPLRYRAYVDPAHPLPEGVERLLDLAVARSEAESLRQQAEQLQVTPEELLTAVRFFIRQVLLAQRADPYHTLGLTPSASPEQIRSHYRKLIRLFHPDREANHDEWHAAYAARINEAYAVLRDPDKRRAYDSRSSHPQRAGDPPKWRAIQDIHVLEAPQERGEIKILRLQRRWLRAALRWCPSLLLIPSPRAHHFKLGLRVALSLAAVSASALFVITKLITLYPSKSIIGLEPLSSRSSASTEEQDQLAPVIPASAPEAQPTSVASLDLISRPAEVEGESQAQGITEQDLEHLLERFASAYRAGDLDDFLALFAGQARTNDRYGHEAIREDYTTFFADTTLHYLRPRDFRWQIDERQAKGQGRFALVVQQKRSPTINIRYGSITMTVERQPQGVMITGLYHQYDPSP